MAPKLITWWLRRVAGEDLANDIAGDAAESGGGAFRLTAIAFAVTVRRISDSLERVSHVATPRTMWADLRHAMRSLRRTAWYLVSSVGVLGLSGGLATAAFAIVDGVLFKPLPYPRAAELFIGFGPGGYAVSTADLDAWRRAAPETQMAMVGEVFDAGAAGAREPRLVRAARVDAQFLDVLGQRPQIGGWVADDFRPGVAPIRVLISHQMWRRDFGGRLDVVGRALDVAGASDRGRLLPRFEVAGVLPRDFLFPSGRATPDFLLPFAPRLDQYRDRNEGGVVLVRTSSMSALLSDRLLSAYGAIRTNVDDERTNMRVEVAPLAAVLLQNQRDSLRSGFVASAVLLLLAIINVAGLAVLRARQRSHEFGLRRALGARRIDLLRLAVLDLVPVVGIGMALAIVITPWAIATAVEHVPPYIVFLKTPAIDARVIGFWFLLSATALAVSAVASVLFARAGEMTMATRRGDQSTARRGRFGSTAIAVQVALAFVMTLGGGLLIGTLWKLWQQPIGYPLESRALVEVSQAEGSAAAWSNATATLVERVRAVAGVERVAVVSAGGSFLSRSRRTVSFAMPTGARAGREGFWPVTREFFDLLEVKPVRGRLFTDDEVSADERVLVLSEQVARKFFGEGEAIGGVMTTNATATPKVYTVIGVVPDLQLSGLSDPGGGQIYAPARASGQRSVLLIQGHAPLASVLDVVRASGVGVMRAQPFKDALAGSVQMTVFRAWLFGAFMVSALTIAGVGIFGVIAMSVSRRTRECGIRVALGARRESLVRMFLREHLLVVAIGIALGAALALLATRFVQAYLFGVTTSTPWIWAAAVAVLVMCAAIAALIPALWASRVNPVDALRAE
jgi:predicted permease